MESNSDIGEKICSKVKELRRRLFVLLLVLWLLLGAMHKVLIKEIRLGRSRENEVCFDLSAPSTIRRLQYPILTDT